MTDKELKQIQKQGHFDIGRMLTESELREIVYLKTGSSQFNWGDILCYIVNNMLEYSPDFIVEVQGEYAKEYCQVHHSSRARGIEQAQRMTRDRLIDLIRVELLKFAFKKNCELMRQLQKGGYFKFFE